MPRILALLTVASAELLDYQAIPGSGGALVHASCVKEAAPGVIVDDNFDLSCDHPLMQPNEQIYAMDAHTDGSVVFKQLNSSFTVPQLPKKGSSGTVFLWPGFKAQAPEPGYPVLQPVLQYGQRPGQEYWELQSWFVWAKHRPRTVAVTGPAIKVFAGDKITSYMELDEAAGLWTVYGKDETTGEDSTLQITSKKTGNMDFAYAVHVLETVMPASSYCDEYPPSGGIDFSSISANHGDSVEWIARTEKTDCQQKVTFSEAGDDVNFAWSAASALV